MLYFPTAGVYTGGEVIAMTLGENLQRLRKAKGLSQDEVAEKLFLTRQSVSKWENDGAEPGVENLKALASLYGVTVDALVGAEELPKEEKPPVPSDGAYLQLLKLRIGAVVVALVCMLINNERFPLLFLLSEFLTPGALVMFLGYWIKKGWIWAFLVGTESLFAVLMAMLLGTDAPFMGLLVLLLVGCWVFRLCQRDIQRLFYKEDEIP